MPEVTVRATSKPGLVAIWEVNPAHPAGELWMVAGDVRTVALTPGVTAALNRGDLTLVEAEPVPAPETAPEPPKTVGRKR